MNSKNLEGVVGLAIYLDSGHVKREVCMVKWLDGEQREGHLLRDAQMGPDDVPRLWWCTYLLGVCTSKESCPALSRCIGFTTTSAATREP